LDQNGNFGGELDLDHVAARGRVGFRGLGRGRGPALIHGYDLAYCLRHGLGCLPAEAKNDLLGASGLSIAFEVTALLVVALSGVVAVVVVVVVGIGVGVAAEVVFMVVVWNAGAVVGAIVVEVGAGLMLTVFVFLKR
jgi:hypothetical protein